MTLSDAMDLLVSYFNPENPAVFVATLTFIVAVITIVVMILNREQPKPEIPRLLPLDNTKSITIKTEAGRTTVSYTVEEGGRS
jgi:hypothetical protein